MKTLLKLLCKLGYHRYKTIPGINQACIDWSIWCGKCSRCGDIHSDSGRYS